MAKKILIIGATGGIGCAITENLLRIHSTVFLHGSQQEKLDDLVGKFTGANITTLTAADFSTLAGIKAFCNEITELGKKFDWIIYVAGYIDEHEPQSILTAEETHKTFLINTIAPIAIVAACEKQISQDGGVIFISSTAGLRGNEKFPVYSASKAALNNFGISLAKKWKDGRHVTIVCPGPTNTEMRQKIAGDSSQHQSPSHVSSLVVEIVTGKRVNPTGSILQIRNGLVSVIDSNL